MKDPASALGERVANRLIEEETWARERLRAHAGRAFRLRAGPFATAFSIRGDGTLEALPALGTSPDVELTVSPLDLPALLSRPERWETLVASTGDAGLAATIRDLATTLPWFVERGFARALGPIVGQRLADAGRAMLGFPEFATGRLAENVFSYARDESGVIARGDEGRAFRDELATIAARVDALAARIGRVA